MTRAALEMLQTWEACLADKPGLRAWPVELVAGVPVARPVAGPRMDSVLTAAARPFAGGGSRDAALRACRDAGRWLAAVHGSRPPGAIYPLGQLETLLDRHLRALEREQGAPSELVARLRSGARRAAAELSGSELSRVPSHADYTPVRAVLSDRGFTVDGPGFSELIPDRAAGCAPHVDLASFRAALLGASWPGALTAQRRAWADAFLEAYVAGGGRPVSSRAVALFELKHLVLMLADRPGIVARWTGGRSRRWVLARWLVGRPDWR